MNAVAAAPEIAASHAACEAITRREAANFYHGLKLTPMPQRDTTPTRGLRIDRCGAVTRAKRHSVTRTARAVPSVRVARAPRA